MGYLEGIVKKYIACLCCGEAREVTQTKKGGLTYGCRECVVRVFVNGKKGMKLLRKKWEVEDVEV